MGRSNHGDDPVTLTQTRRPGARVQGSDQDIVVLVVPGGTGFEA